MSNNESFIDEVAEEVRRDKLYGYLRRYGWIAVAAVLLIVGAASWIEYRNAQARNQAQANGDALIAALNETDPAARAAEMQAASVDGPAAIVQALLSAAMQEEADDIDAARATLDALATNPDTPELYRDVAALKSAMLPSDDTQAKLLALEQLSQPGRPFRLLALEQKAYIEVAGGEVDAAIATLNSIVEDASVTRGLQERAQTLMVSLGAPLPTQDTQ